MFALAVVSVAAYLVLKAGGVLQVWPTSVAEQLSYFFTFLGVLPPTFGGAFASIRYGRVADLVHATDDVVVSEIESWQAVFGGKHVTVPV
jgi:hypothetical protein